MFLETLIYLESIFELACVFVPLKKKEGSRDHLRGVKHLRTRITSSIDITWRYKVLNLVKLYLDLVLGLILCSFGPISLVL